MKKHEILSPQSRAALFDPPTDPAAIVRQAARARVMKRPKSSSSTASPPFTLVLILTNTAAMTAPALATEMSCSSAIARMNSLVFKVLLLCSTATPLPSHASPQSPSQKFTLDCRVFAA